MAIVADKAADPLVLDDALANDVREELERIISHPHFSETTRLKRFLRYVVEEALAGRGSRLKGYSVGLEVFDRPESFDPQADTIVRVQAGQLRRRLDLYYAEDGRDSTLRILLPKGSYVPVFERRSPAPLLLGSEGDDGDTAPTKPMRPYMGDKNRPGIFVPTFVDLSGDQQQSYFAEGLTAEIINALVQFRYLRVIAGSSSVLPSAGAPLSHVADAYKADFVLAGTIRRSGDLVRVSTNLISTKTGDHVLSKIFDRECTPENLFEIQESIASYTAANIGAPFGAVNRFNRRLSEKTDVNMGGYSALLKYYTMSLDASGEDARALLADLEDVTEKSPLFSSAWAALSLLHSFFIGQVVPSRDIEKNLKSALSEAHRAVLADPDNALAFHAQFVAAYHAGDFETYEKSAERAMTLNPNDYNLLAHYAVTQAMRGRIDTARAYHAAALELIATPPVWFLAADTCCDFQEGDYAAVIQKTDGLTTSSPAGVILFRMAACGLTGRVEEVAELRDQMLAGDNTIFASAMDTFQTWHPLQDLFDTVDRGWKAAMSS